MYWPLWILRHKYNQHKFMNISIIGIENIMNVLKFSPSNNLLKFFTQKRYSPILQWNKTLFISKCNYVVITIDFWLCNVSFWKNEACWKCAREYIWFTEFPNIFQIFWFETHSAIVFLENQLISIETQG